MAKLLSTILLVLLTLGANPAFANSTLIVEETLMESHPIIFAIDRDDAASLQLWLKAGHTPLAKIKNDIKERLIERAMYHTSLHCFELLLRAVHALKADTELKDSRGTPLLVSLTSLAVPAKPKTSLYEQMVALVLSVVPSLVQSKDQAYIGDGRTALQQAAAIGNIMVMQMLISSGAGINAKNSNGETALHFAARFNHLDAVKYLVASGASINEKTHYTRSTPLMAAAEMGNETIIRYLVLSGAERDAKDIFGKTAPERFREFRVATIAKPKLTK